jgi:hypothetical protein
MTTDTEELGPITTTLVYPWPGLMLSTSEMREHIQDLIELNEDREITEEYIQAFRTMDIDKLNYFLSMGPSVRHQVMNIQEYRHGQIFGFNEVKFGDYGWLAKVTWNDVEKIEIATDRHFAHMNYITLGKGNNSLWTYGVSFSYGNGGSMHGLSVYGEICSSKEEAKTRALKELTADCEKLISSEHTNKKDLAYAQSLFKLILAMKGEELQLSLF